MGLMFSMPAGLTPAEKAHRLARSNMPTVKADAFGKAFPEPVAFAALPQAMRHEAALLARESKSFAAFRAAAGARAEDVLRQGAGPLVAPSLGDSDDSVRANGHARATAERFSRIADAVADLVETCTEPGEGIVRSVDLYRRAVLDGRDPGCGARFFAQVLQHNHGAGQILAKGADRRQVCLPNRVWK